MEKVRNYRDLLIWQRSIDLVQSVYLATKSFPSDEQYGLTNQLRRSIVSVPSNIAEGQARGSSKEFKRFLHIALGSLAEAHTQLILACRLKYLPQEQLKSFEDEVFQIQRMTHALMRKLPTNN